MTITHVSHYDLVQIKGTETLVWLEGTKAACFRMAYAHGLEVKEYEGRTVSVELPGQAIKTPADKDNFSFAWFVQGGYIFRQRDNYLLAIPREIWNEKI